MKLPTEKRLKKYLKDVDTKCPFCGSDQTEGSSFDQEANQVWQKISCSDCDQEWVDVYVLKRVEIWGEGEILIEGEI